MSLGRLRWGWTLIGGVVAEIALMLFVPIQFLPGGETARLGGRAEKSLDAVPRR